MKSFRYYIIISIIIISTQYNYQLNLLFETFNYSNILYCTGTVLQIIFANFQKFAKLFDHMNKETKCDWNMQSIVWPSILYFKKRIIWEELFMKKKNRLFLFFKRKCPEASRIVPDFTIPVIYSLLVSCSLLLCLYLFLGILEWRCQ